MDSELRLVAKREGRGARTIRNDKHPIAANQVKKRVHVTEGGELRDPEGGRVHRNVGRLPQVDWGGKEGLRQGGREGGREGRKRRMV